MPYYLVRHKVQDYAKWKPIFDQHGAIRQVYGHRGGQLFRNADDHNELLILWEVDDLEKGVSFFSRRIYDRRCNGPEWRTSLTSTSWKR
jgi:hypothetical protein